MTRQGRPIDDGERLSFNVSRARPVSERLAAIHGAHPLPKTGPVRVAGCRAFIGLLLPNGGE